MAEYKRHVSQQEFNPSVSQKQFNPPPPANDIEYNYQRKQDIANQIISISKSFGRAFGAAHLRKQDEDELERLANNKIDRENLIQAEIEGKALAASGSEYNETIATNIINRSFQFRKNNPKLIAMINRGYKLKTGELTVTQFNSNIKVKAPGLVKQLGLEWLKRQQEIESISDNKSPSSPTDFTSFVAEYVDTDTSETIMEMLDENDLIDEVLAKDGKRLNYDSVFNEASKWYKDYKIREKEQAIDRDLSLQSWGEVTGKEWRESGRPNLMEKHDIREKGVADLKLIEHLRGELNKRYAQEGTLLLGDPLFTSIYDILSYSPDGGISLLKAKGEHKIGVEAEKLLTLTKKIHKQLFDANEKVNQNKENKAEKQREKTNQLTFSRFGNKIQERIRVANSETDIKIIIDDIIKQTNVLPLEKNITTDGTLGNLHPADFIKIAVAKGKEIREEEGKPKTQPELTPDQLKIITNAETRIGNITKNKNLLSNLKTEEDVNSIKKLVLQIERIYQEVITDPTHGLGTGWKDFDKFYTKYHSAIDTINEEQEKLITRLEKESAKDDVFTKKSTNYKNEIRRTAENKMLATSIVDKIHDGLEAYLKLTPETRKDTALDNIEKLLTKKVKQIVIKGDGLVTDEVEIDLFNAKEQDNYRRLIANHREINRRDAEDRAKVAPIDTDPVLYEEINGEINGLSAFSPIVLHKDDGKINNIRKKLNTKLLSKELSTVHYSHFDSILTKLSKNVEATLDKTYGSKTVYDNADRMLNLSIAGSAADGLNTILSTSDGLLLKNTRGDLLRFHQSMVDRYPSIFSDTTSDNHPIRQAILRAYVEWLEGTEKTEDILKKYIDVREFAGEKESRFTKLEEQTFRDSIPKNTSPHAEAFSKLAIRIGTRPTSSSTPKKKGEKKVTEVKTNQSFNKLIDEAAEKGVVMTPEQLQKAAEGQGYIFELAGDYAYHIVPVDNTSVSNSDTQASLGL